MGYVTAVYVPKNPQKYNGKYPIKLKSSWEIDFVVKDCDLNPNCIRWSYEPVQIPYYDPVTNKQKVYVPDFMFTFLTASGHIKTMLLEIKPMHEYLRGYAKSKADAAVQARNASKFEAAIAWCIRRGIEFKILTEADIFIGAKNKAPRKRPIRPYKPRKI